MRLPLLAIALALLHACATPPQTPASPAPTPPPNIVWIVAEDLSPRLPPFGDSTVATPHLSRLAAEGVRYPNTFSVSGVCAPSRSALITGMYPTSIGSHHMRTRDYGGDLTALGLPVYDPVLPEGVAPLPLLLRAAGYYATNNDKRDYQFEAPRATWDDSSPLADYRGRAPGQPFFAVYNLDVTHESQVWVDYHKHYRFRENWPDSSQLDAWAADVPPVDPGLDVPIPPYLVPDDSTRRDVQRVYRNVETMDRQVGFLLDRLRADGLLDSTIVVWYADHGGPLPREKRLLYDAGLRVPMIVRWPDGYRAGQIDSALVSFVDFHPTTLAMAGADIPDVTQGVVAFDRTANATRDYVYAAADRLDRHRDRIRAVRDRRYKLLRNHYPERPYYLPVAYRENMPATRSLLRGRDAGTLTPAQAQWFRETKDSIELFDTHADPHELHNLARDPAYAKTVQRLRDALDAWTAEVGDLGALDEREMVRAWWGGQIDSMPATPAPVLEVDDAGWVLAKAPLPSTQVAYRFAQADRGREAWRVYTGPVAVPAGDTVVAVGQRVGFRESDVVSAP